MADTFDELTADSTGDPQLKIKALDELFARSANYRKSGDYLALLQFINKFPALSPFNAFLIHMQNKGVQLVMSAAKWRKYGRSPKYNSRPLIILVPFGPVEFVFDIADTDGKALPPELINPFHTKGKASFKMVNQLVNSLQKDGLIYEEYIMHKGAAGYAVSKRSGRKVVINSTLSPEEKISTLIHELAHIYCGHLGVDHISWWLNRNSVSNEIMEIEAESISFLVCSRFNLVTSSDAYLSNYIKKFEDIQRISLDTILVVAGYIESMLRPGFRPKARKNK